MQNLRGFATSSRFLDRFCGFTPGRPSSILFRMRIEALRRRARLTDYLRSGIARRLRRSEGWSLRDVADALGCSEAAVSLWERGLRRPTSDYAESYLAILESMTREDS